MLRRASPIRLVSHLAQTGKANMATQAASTEAPWRAQFLEHVSSMKTPTFALSTLHPVPASERVAPSIPVLPRARTCIYRGLWASLPPNGHSNPAPANPEVWESDCPTFTTDARMPKAADLMDTAANPASSGRQTGGGGPVEAVWWVEDTGTQWRVRGTAWVLGPDVEGDDGRAAREAILARMRRRDGGKEEDWSWSREVTAHFGNMSPTMRGGFKGPTPGTPIAVPPEHGQRVGQEVHDLEDETARKNFRVVVIVPTEVDQVEFLDPKKPRRWVYIYRGRSGQAREPGGEILGEWEKVELWP